MKTNDSLYYQIILNGTLTGASFNSVDPNSLVQFDIDATIITGGTVLDSGYIAATGRQTINAAVNSLLKVVADIVGNADILTLVLTNLLSSDTGSTFYSSIAWKEYR